MNDRKLKVVLIDDEELALKRLARMLAATSRVEIAWQETDPEAALAQLSSGKWREQIDALFLDIQMPVLNGFELLSRLNWQPLVIFTTAYDQYALRAFEVNSIDYLLKPVEQAQLERTLNKIARFVAAPPAKPHNLHEVAAQLAEVMKTQQHGWPTRIASRTGERIRLIELSRITHFLAQDKLTYAVTIDGNFAVDQTIAELERELNPQQFIRIHRAILLNTDYVDEVHPWFGGRLMIRLKDGKRTELTVARDRVKSLKSGLRF